MDKAEQRPQDTKSTSFEKTLQSDSGLFSAMVFEFSLKKKNKKVKMVRE